MLTICGHVITPLTWDPCLCIKYFGIVNVLMTYKFGLLICYFDHLAFEIYYTTALFKRFRR